jgi:hypothetical protein
MSSPSSPKAQAYACPWRHEGEEPGVFLVGDIPGSSDWQKDTISKLSQSCPGLVFYYNPPVHSGPRQDEKIKWQFEMLRQAKMIVFWFPASINASADEGRALYQLGVWSTLYRHTGTQIRVGCHPDSLHRKDVEAELRLSLGPHFPVYSSLEKLCNSVEEWWLHSGYTRDAEEMGPRKRQVKEKQNTGGVMSQLVPSVFDDEVMCRHTVTNALRALREATPPEGESDLTPLHYVLSSMHAEDPHLVSVEFTSEQLAADGIRCHHWDSIQVMGLPGGHILLGTQNFEQAVATARGAFAYYRNPIAAYKGKAKRKAEH